jgi:hypothetical protein
MKPWDRVRYSPGSWGKVHLLPKDALNKKGKLRGKGVWIYAPCIEQHILAGNIYPTTDQVTCLKCLRDGRGK